MIKPISLPSNDKREIELALNRLIREIAENYQIKDKSGKIAYADKPTAAGGGPPGNSNSPNHGWSPRCDGDTLMGSHGPG
jgi:hypothetical protein